jgi:hypothetical protein
LEAKKESLFRGIFGSTALFPSNRACEALTSGIEAGLSKDFD